MLAGWGTGITFITVGKVGASRTSQNKCFEKSQKLKELWSTCDFIIKVKEFII